MIKNKRVSLPILLCLLAVGYVLFITQGLPIVVEAEFPFGISDRFGNYTDTADILASLISFVRTGIDYYNRPVRVLFQRVTYALFGLNSFGYYFIKAILVSLVLCLLSFLLKDKKRIIVYAGLFYLFAPPIYLEIVELQDISLLAELLIFASFYFFLNLYREEGIWKNRVFYYGSQIMIILLCVIANGAKGSARIIPFVLLSFVILDNPKKIFKYIPLALILLLNVMPVSYFWKGSQGWAQALKDLPYGIDFHRIYQLYITNPAYNACYSASLLKLIGILKYWLLGGTIIFIYRKTLAAKYPDIFNELKIEEQDKSLFAFAGIWLFWTMMIAAVYSATEPQRLNNSLLPAILLIFLFLYYLERLFKGPYQILVRRLILGTVILVEIVSLGRTFILRDKNTTYRIAQDNLHSFIEKVDAAKDSLVLVFRGGVLPTQANINSSNTYLPTLTTFPERIIIQPEFNKKKYKHIYLASGFSPIKDSESKGWRYLTVVNGSTNSIYDRIRELMPFPKAYSYYVYRYEEDLLSSGKIKGGLKYQESPEISPAEIDFAGNYICVDYDMGNSCNLEIKKISEKKVEARFIYDDFWGWEDKAEGVITGDRVKLNLDKTTIVEIFFRRDKTIRTFWREGNFEQKQGQDFGRLAGAE